MLTRLDVQNFRSLRRVSLPVGPLTVVTGPNGCGKTNLYRALELLQHAAGGTLARRLCDQGGMNSVLWAGPRSTKGQVHVRLAVRMEVPPLEGGLHLDFAVGLPPPSSPSFELDPDIKDETLHLADGSGRKTVLLQRNRLRLKARHDSGRLVDWPGWLNESESAFSQLRDAIAFPELAVVRDAFLAWRFYHEFRVDADSPLRLPRPGVRTVALASDGLDLAPALETIRRQGDLELLAEAVDAIAPGATLDTESRVEGVYEVQLRVPGLLRPLSARELSDGQLRYLCLAAALLATRPPPLRAFNEPESSLHGEMLPRLARLFAHAARHGQIWVTTHSPEFAQLLAEAGGVRTIPLEKVKGETRVVGQRLSDFLDDSPDDGPQE